MERFCTLCNFRTTSEFKFEQHQKMPSHLKIEKAYQQGIEVGENRSWITIADLLCALKFAVNNAHNFTEHDPDDVKKAWIEEARAAITNAEVK